MKSGDFVRTTLIVEDEKTIRNKLMNFIYFYKADLIVLELLFSWYNYLNRIINSNLKVRITYA